MVEIYKDTPFSKRPSQNLHFMDYVKDELLWWLAPLIGGLATLVAGRLTKGKVPIIDGSPMIIVSLYEKAAEFVLGRKIITNEVERLAPYTAFLPEEKRLPATRDIWNFLKGTEIVIPFALYHFWKRSREENLDLVASYDRMEKLGQYMPTRDDWKAERDARAQELTYLKTGEVPELAVQMSEAEYEGKLVEARNKAKKSGSATTSPSAIIAQHNPAALQVKRAEESMAARDAVTGFDKD